MNKDWNALTKEVGKHALRKEFGGDLPVDDVNGHLLAEFLKLFNEQFECKQNFDLKINEVYLFKFIPVMSRAGYGINDEAMKKKITEGATEVLGYISKK